MIRPLEKKDILQVVKIENELFKNPWNQENFEYELENNPFSHLYVLEIDGRLIGYFDLWITFDKADLANIGICKAYQRQHFGQMMFDFLLDLAKQEGCEIMSLEVRVSNTPAITFYEKNGFEKVNIRKNYYEDHEDAFLMVKAIGGFEDYDETIGD